MKIVLEVPDNKASFIMELIESIPFIKIKNSQDTVVTHMDTTEYLLSSSANKQRLLEAIDRSKRGEVEYHDLLEK